MINLKKHDAVADAVKAVMQQEAITTDTLAGRVAGGESNLAKSYKITLKGDGADKAPEGKKAESTAARKSIKAEEVETVEEGWDDMLKSVADKKKPQPNGGSGIKKGKSYGNQKPEKDEKEVKEETVTEGLGDAVKTLAKKTFKAFTGGNDQDQLKRLQKNMGVAQTGKVPSKANEEVELDEALKGDQHKIDKNHNGKVDGHDFKLLRSGKSLSKFKSEKKK
jgi:hypothetical protein